MKNKFFTKKNKKFSKLIQGVIMVLFLAILLIPHFAFAKSDGADDAKGVGADAEDRVGGATGSVPVNTDICLLAVAGIAYCAKKFYHLRQQHPALA